MNAHAGKSAGRPFARGPAHRSGEGGAALAHGIGQGDVAVSRAVVLQGPCVSSIAELSEPLGAVRWPAGHLQTVPLESGSVWEPNSAEGFGL
jgi:hypothetical protein